MPLLPKDLPGRARVRGLAQIVACDGHPLAVPRGASTCSSRRGSTTRALDAIEANLVASPHTGRYCHGDMPTIADICLASHLIALQLFKVDASAYPRTLTVYRHCEQIPPFADSHPLKQPGAPSPA